MNKLNIFLFTILLFILAVIGYYFVFIYPKQFTPPPVLGQVQGFQLVDSNNRIFTQDNLKGKVWVADLFFTSCPGICPMLTKKMKTLYLSYELEDNVRFVSVSVDPERDKPDVLQKYANQYNVKTRKWHFLTGSFENIKELATNQLKLVAKENPNFHSEHFVLVDQNMKIRGYYNSKEKEELKKIFHDIALVLEEGK